jgi:8-oxo-dGTP pyrophosphatase MutT (NUDIX family)
MAREISAGTVVFRDSPPKFLLLHYSAGHWDFPKGNIEAGEKPEQTALRELEEEAGIEGRIMPGFKEKISYFYRRGAETVHKEVIFFLAEAAPGKVTLSWEHKGFRWLPFREALSQLTFRNAKGLLEKANSFLKASGRV